ncbi:Regulator of RpoS [Paenibacillus allorhizoplanae]|uniref:Regulator of RpoS n=1 Tax=Paenibacillus allorhizoplanae TaxID=2905648 RepID=A0ABM9CQL1_9BACL|nr:response regulator [Paenibacillus allorhizoplanae]CAH1221489.1 Regulator of RpoS [Paenibacillus allorhizoplanae]
MTKFQLLFIRQFDETIASWRSANEPIREADLYGLLHRIKGTAATIDLQEWTEVAEQLLIDLTEDGLRLWTLAEFERFIQSIMALRKATDTLGEQNISNRAMESFRESAAAVEAEPLAPVMISEVPGPLVLLIDDDVAFLQLIKERLEQEGCIVLATPYPDKAIKWFYELKPDCIVLDVVMPGHSGFDLLTILQERSQRFMVPVLLISAQNDTDVRIRAYQSGADDFISKPFDLNEFVVRVLNKLRRKQAISRMILTDELTGLYNTQYLRIRWQQISQEAIAEGKSYWAAQFDIDAFRSLNERYGHAAADGYLHHTAGWLRAHIRTDELLVRWERDRFVLLGREGTLETISLRLNQLSELFTAHTFEIAGDAVNMSLSYVFTTLDGAYDPDACIAALGEAMRDMKLGLRNRLSGAHTVVDIQRKGACRVAVIDDDPLIRNMLERRLRDMEIVGGEGLEIRTFADGEAFFSDVWHNGEHAYLLILDRMMPRMNGMEVLTRLRTDYPADKYRILMLTGNGDETEIAQAIRAGTDDYVTKPFRLPELEARIRRLLQGRSR